MRDSREHALRIKAIRLHENGIGFNIIKRRVQRSDSWLTKWLRRYWEFGEEGLLDQSRAPIHIPNRTRDSIIGKILAVRDELAAHKTRRSAFAGIGAETIHHELFERGLQPLPAISTIEKILARAGRTRKIKIRKAPKGPPYPYIRARTMGDLQQTDLVGPRHVRGPQGLTRFYSIHTIDVAGQTVSAHQFRDKQTISLVLHLLDSWKIMGLPEALPDAHLGRAWNSISRSPSGSALAVSPSSARGVSSRKIYRRPRASGLAYRQRVCLLGS